MSDELGRPSSEPDPYWLEQFVENQKQELAVRAQELDLAKQQDKHHVDYAKEALAAQERDRKDERDCARLRSKDRYRLVVCLVLIVAILIGVAMYSGNTDLAAELVKAIIFVSAGAFGGYGYAKKNVATSSDTPDQG